VLFNRPRAFVGVALRLAAEAGSSLVDCNGSVIGAASGTGETADRGCSAGTSSALSVGTSSIPASSGLSSKGLKAICGGASASGIVVVFVVAAGGGAGTEGMVAGEAAGAVAGKRAAAAGEGEMGAAEGIEDAEGTVLGATRVYTTLWQEGHC
jgi:hypothetical protein